MRRKKVTQMKAIRGQKLTPYERRYRKELYGSVIPPNSITSRGRKYTLEDPTANMTAKKCYSNAKFMRDGGYNAICKKFGNSYYIYIRHTRRVASPRF